jgi:hypothetical protein
MKARCSTCWFSAGVTALPTSEQLRCRALFL